MDGNSSFKHWSHYSLQNGNMATNRLPPPSRSGDGDGKHTIKPTSMIYQELSEKQEPTDSHAISQIDTDEKGLV